MLRFWFVRPLLTTPELKFVLSSQAKMQEELTKTKAEKMQLELQVQNNPEKAHFISQVKDLEVNGLYSFECLLMKMIAPTFCCSR